MIAPVVHRRRLITVTQPGAAVSVRLSRRSPSDVEFASIAVIGVRVFTSTTGAEAAA